MMFVVLFTFVSTNISEAKIHKHKKVITMNISDLLNKVSEAGVSLWDLQEYHLVIKDSNNNPINIGELKVDADKKTINIKTKK